MGYLFLFIACFSGLTKGYCGKRISAFTKEYKSAMLQNSLRMLICILIGFFFVIFDGGFQQFKLCADVILISALSGTMTSLFVVSWLLSVRRGAYMMVDVFLTLGVTVPIILSAIFYHEPVRLNQLIGLIILFAAAFIMCSYNNEIKSRLTFTSLILLVLAGVSNGLADFSQKLFIKTATTTLPSTFNFYTYVFSALSLIIVFAFSSRGGESFKESVATLKKSYAYIIIMALCLFLNSYFKTLAAKYLSSAELYPLNQGASLILATLMSALFFGEKIKPKCIVGIALSFLGLIFMNVLNF